MCTNILAMPLEACLLLAERGLHHSLYVGVLLLPANSMHHIYSLSVYCYSAIYYIIIRMYMYNVANSPTPCYMYMYRYYMTCTCTYTDINVYIHVHVYSVHTLYMHICVISWICLYSCTCNMNACTFLITRYTYTHIVHVHGRTCKILYIYT